MGDSPVIYLDIVFAINFVMDWLILWSVARFLQLSTSIGRLTGGALTGALYAAMLLLPPLSFLATLLAKLLFSLMIVKIAFPWGSWRSFFQILGCFYLISFLAGGAVLGGVYLVQDQGMVVDSYNGMMTLTNLPVFWLLISFATLFFFSFLGATWFRKQLLKKHYSVPTVVCFGDQQILAKALVDTGNQLRDPLSQRPVMVMEYSLLKELLPKELDDLFRTSAELHWDQIVETLGGTPWEIRVRVIPFHSLGNRQGMLLGLIPDGVYLEIDKQVSKHCNVIVGVYHGALCPDRKYQALLHPELLQMDLGA